MRRHKRGKDMNLTIVKEELLKIGESVGFKVHEETAEQLTIHAQITAKGHFSNVYFRVVVYESGTLHMFMTFHQIEKTYDNLFLINAFNSESPWFRAYISNINDKDYLELHYASFLLETEKEVSTTVVYLLQELLNENTLKYLKPILNNTK